MADRRDERGVIRYHRGALCGHVVGRKTPGVASGCLAWLDLKALPRRAREPLLGRFFLPDQPPDPRLGWWPLLYVVAEILHRITGPER